MKITILIMLSLTLVLSTKAQSNPKVVKSKVGPDIVAYQKAGSSVQAQNQTKRKNSNILLKDLVLICNPSTKGIW